MARSLPKNMAPWQTLHVRVVMVRGQAIVRAQVDTTFVTGVVGSTGGVPRPLWEGPVGLRDPERAPSPEDAALWAREALGKAFPTLF